MSTETTNKKIKIDNGTTFGRTYTDKAVDAKLPTDLIASANKLSLGVGTTALGNGVNLDGFTYDEATKTLKVSGGGGSGGSSFLRKNGTFVDEYEGVVANRISLSPAEYGRVKNGEITTIYGDCRLKANVISTYKVDFNNANNNDMFIYKYTDVLVGDNEIQISDYQLTITKEDATLATLAIMTTKQPRIPTLPTDASSKTYTLKAVNGVLTWVE